MSLSLQNRVASFRDRVKPREQLTNPNAWLLLTGLVFWGVVIAYAYSFWVPRPRFVVLFLGIGVIAHIFREVDEMEYEGTRLQNLNVVALTVSAIVTIVTTYYLYVNFEELLIERPAVVFEHELMLGAAFILVIAYLTYRAFGLAFLLVFFAAIFYTLFGYLFPGIMYHAGLSHTRVIRVLTLQFDGFYGTLTQITAAWIALFFLYGGLLQGFGAFDLIIRVSLVAAKQIKSGVAQTAVIASMIVGSINGASTANAAMTGAVTIPLMKKHGLSAKSAGAIEAVASSGGQILPPVMGAAAFIMASLLSTSYVNILIAGIVPAILFYATVALSVHYIARDELERASTDLDFNLESMDVRPMDREELVFEGIKHLIPFTLLIIFLGVLQYSITYSALLTVVATVVTGITVPLVREVVLRRFRFLKTVKRTVRQAFLGFYLGTRLVAPIVVIVAPINGVVDLLGITGFPGKLSLALIDLSGGSLFLAVMLSMAVCILLGLGMPTVAAYILVALLVAPTLVTNFDIAPISAHYFVFYAAILSGLTPPIAVTVVVASGVADSNFWSTCLTALKVGAIMFILPIVFIYNPDILIWEGYTSANLVAMVFALIGGLFIVHGLFINRLDHYDRARQVKYMSAAIPGIRLAYVGLGILCLTGFFVFFVTPVLVAMYIAERLVIERRTRHLAPA